MTDSSIYTTKKDIKDRTTSNELIQGIHGQLGTATHKRNRYVHNNLHIGI
jgi:hypothetical protein